MMIFLEIGQAGTLKTSSTLFEPWMIGIFMAILVVLAWIRVAAPESFSQLGKGLFNIRVLRQLIREEGTIAALVSRLLGLCFFLIISLGLYLGMQIFGATTFGLSGFGLYSVLFAGLMAMYAVKLVGIFAIRFILGGDFGLNEMIFNLLAHNNIVGLLSFPLILLVVVIPAEVHSEALGVTQSLWPKTLLILTASIVIIAYISRLCRAMINSVQLRLSSVYIIFYLCTLEFLPLALLNQALKG